MTLTRRRFLTISAVAACLPAAANSAAPARHWTGQALGARTSIRLNHPDAAAITARCLAEIDRLEDILSLYRDDSQLSRLNRDSSLDAPAFELLDCLALAGAVHGASGGRFDPTVQPLWSLWAEAAARGHRPDAGEIADAIGHVGWAGLSVEPSRLALRPGMALTLNGIGQGYVADRVAALLQAEGLTDILLDTGELRALGTSPDGGGDWPVRLDGGGAVALRNRALATSSPLGTSFDTAGRDGHILDPRTGHPVRSAWRQVSISAPSAALADALSTAACLTADRADLVALLGAFPAARLEDASPALG